MRLLACAYNTYGRIPRKPKMLVASGDGNWMVGNRGDRDFYMCIILNLLSFES